MALSKNKKFIIFDLDGTLINSVPDLNNAVNYGLKKLGYREISFDEIIPTIGQGATEMLGGSLKISKGEIPSKEEITNLKEIYTDYYTQHSTVDTFLYPHVKETIEYLSKKGYTLAICTNKPLSFVEPIIEHFEIKQFIKEWIGEDSLEKKKPDPLPLNYLMNKYEFSKEETCMVGDSKNDILAAQNAGIESIGVSYGYNYDESIADYNPTVVVDDFGEIKDLLI